MDLLTDGNNALNFECLYMNVQQPCYLGFLRFAFSFDDSMENSVEESGFRLSNALGKISESNRSTTIFPTKYVKGYSNGPNLVIPMTKNCY